MYNYSGNLSKQDFMEFENKYKGAFDDYNDSIIDDSMLLRFINEALFDDLDEKMKWLKKIGDKTAIEQFEALLAEKNIDNGEVLVLQAVDADPDTDFWPKYLMGVFTSFDAAVKYIETDFDSSPMYYLIKYRANNDGQMRNVCTFVWNRNLGCLCYVAEEITNYY